MVRSRLSQREMAITAKSKSPPGQIERKLRTPNLVYTKSKPCKLGSLENRIKSLSRSSSRKKSTSSSIPFSNFIGRAIRKGKGKIQGPLLQSRGVLKQIKQEDDQQIESLRQFNLCFHEVVKKNDPRNSGILNYKKAVSVLTDLGFMRASNDKQTSEKERQLFFDMWRICKGNENNGINIRNFKLFLLAIMKFNFSWMKSSKYNNEISLSLSNTHVLKSELKNLSA